mmetsp:Transcript_16408/g.39050  ORF Transcript_16408/g.39050 Transcript_16408/m.39050 type:complete len:306 (+) Transcript_16408:675-1592(+)
MVVGDDGRDLEAGVDQIVHKHTLDLGLARLEVVSGDLDLVALGHVDDARNKSVLGGAVDVGAALEDGGDGEDVRRSDLLMGIADGLQDVVGGVVHARDDLAEALGVRAPHDNDLVDARSLLEVADVLADLIQVGLLGARKAVVSAGALVGSNPVRVVYGRARLHALHVRAELTLEVVLENRSSVHRVGKVGARDVPAVEHNVGGLDHGEKGLHRKPDVVSPGGAAEAHRGGLRHRPVEVGCVHALLCTPGEAELVGEATTGDGRAVVAAPADDHHAELGHVALSAELHVLGGGHDAGLALRHMHL